MLESSLNLEFLVFKWTSAGNGVDNVISLLQRIGDRKVAGHVVGVVRLYNEKFTLFAALVNDVLLDLLDSLLG